VRNQYSAARFERGPEANTNEEQYRSMFSLHVNRTLVFPERDKSRVAEMVDLRFILHLFLSWTSPR
jgi:hypothetical protein